VYIVRCHEILFFVCVFGVLHKSQPEQRLFHCVLGPQTRNLKNMLRSLGRMLRLDIAHRHRRLEGFEGTKEVATALTKTEEKVGTISGVPADELSSRVVRIFKPAPSPMQSGTAGYNRWKLEWSATADARWSNPLTVRWLICHCVTSSQSSHFTK
jgi:hypothetical protein